MSKRKKILIATGVFLLLAVVGVLSAYKRGWIDIGDPVFSEEIPEARPKRLDRKQLEMFSGESIESILKALTAETGVSRSASQSDLTDPSKASSATTLLGMLPDAPLPFGETAAPQDPAGLKAFVTGMKQDSAGEPSPSEEWQFNLALAALKVDQSAVPESIRRETQPVPESEIFPVRLLLRESDLSGPFAVGNFDGGEGLEIVAGGGSSLFKLRKDGSLESAGSLSGILPGNGVFPADFDGDGDLDLFITRGGGLPNSLLRNVGGGTFEDVTIATGLLSFSDTTTAAWLDYDGDGLLDLLVGSRDHPLELYQQTSGGIFQPVAWDLKLWVPRGVHTIRAADFSGDGFPDFYLGIEGLDDRLYLALPSESWSEWRFEELSLPAGITHPRTATSAAFFDFDNDGMLDLLLTTSETVPMVPTSQPDNTPSELLSTVRLFRNEGEGQFVEVTDAAGLQLDEGITAAGISDLDNDGFEDIFLGTGALSINRVFWNREGTGFREISVVSRGSYLDQPIAVAAADLDGSGTVDLLYLNESGRIRWLEAAGADQRWIRVRIPSHPPGTRLSLTVRDQDWVLHTVERHLGTDSAITIGIGRADLVERLDVFAGRGDAPVKSNEKIEPDQELVVELPKVPKKRPVVPMEGDPLETTTR